MVNLEQWNKFKNDPKMKTTYQEVVKYVKLEYDYMINNRVPDDDILESRFKHTHRILLNRKIVFGIDTKLPDYAELVSIM